ncbi:SDR family NAD(P)-dependent oxidoreductase [Acidocella sp. KAb 2-4]|uniref:SDR family NAD(P)-dependent oxidoreductase n=1 Tax=Acidocella sp. KAb 2-4 TaxID=2885158 RepID=UPI001D064C27|nr:SDR family NAD(P)-dependent oxidoreductase [Acidocella sp. KAb 2-4]MCB5944271.1 SDR family NAD(P)-dependent oxidoreductase [Acidocella sp. KAb 2-4]
MGIEAGRTALVVGAAGGIGLEAVRQLQGQARIFAVVQNEEQAAQVAPLVVRSFVCDVADAASVEALLAALIPALAGRLDALLFCAAVQPVSPVELMSRAALEKIFAINVFGTVSVVQGMLPLLRAARGRIVLFSSMAGRVAAPMIGGYAASKFALEALADALRRELHGSGIAISLVEPGGVNTPMAAAQGPLVDQALAGMDAQTEATYGALYRGYRKMATGALKFASKPEDVARVAVRAAIGPGMPKLRYLVGKDAQLTVLLSRLLPTRWMDAMLARMTSSK